jgi:hypothetical protein
MQHSGSLRADSPGLYGSLKKFASAAELEQLEEAFLAAWKLGAGTEAPITRDPGVSYNPRPARIATILIKECQNLAAQEIAACFWISAITRGAELPQTDYAGKQLAQQAFAALNDSSLPTLKANALRIAAAVLVDSIRHLHMSSLSDTERQAEINHSKRFIAGLPDGSIDARILAVLQHATSRGAPK